MLKVSIDDSGIQLNGSGMELLNGLSNYIYALHESGCPLLDLQCAIDKGLNKTKKSVLRDREVNMVEEVKVHRINTKDLSEEEVAKIIAKIIKKNN